MGYRHSGATILAAAVDLVAQQGLASLTYRTVAEQLGVADRTIVYYFPTKDDLILAVLEVLSGELEQRAAAAVGDTPISASELLARTWMMMQTEPVRPAVRVYFEVVGRAAAGQSPFAALAAPMTHRWIGWLEARLTGPAATRQRRAAGLLAQLDGLMLLQQMAGIHVARTAATGLGLTNSPPHDDTDTLGKGTVIHE
jgi:AcrR family transcriptional regulator